MTTASFGYQLFRAVKYATYALLTFNLWLFLSQEIVSAQHAASDSGVAMGIQLFSATLDTAAWVVLLLLFELETAVIPDHRLHGAPRYTIHGVRMLCTLAIVMAFLGYVGEWETLKTSESLLGSACELVSQDWSAMQKLDDFVPLTLDNCALFGADTLVVSGLDRVLASPAGFLEAQRLALVDVMNAGAWILVVVVLEAELRLMTREGGVSRPVALTALAVKCLLYATLVVAAVYWGVKGDFLDFWDAALWLFAFVFIELNVFEWQQEIQDQQAEA